VLLLVIFIAKELLWTYVTPPWEAPDETGHYGYVESMFYEKKFPVLGETLFSSRVMAVGPEESQKQTDKYIGGSSLNWIAQHPPLYYLLLEPFYAILPHDNVLPSIFFLRFFSVFLGCVTLYFGWKTVRILVPDQEWLQVAVIVGMAFLPMFSSISASVNNDNLVFALSAYLLYRSLKFFEKEDTANNIILGIILGLLALTKVTALPLFGGILVIETIKHVRLRKKNRNKCGSFWGHLGTVFGIAFIIAGWWYIRNYVLYQSFLPDLVTVVNRHPEILVKFPKLATFFPEVVSQSAKAGTGLYDFFITKNFLLEYFKNIWGAFGRFFFQLADWQYAIIYLITALSVAGYIRVLYLAAREKNWPTLKQFFGWKGGVIWYPFLFVSVAVTWKLYIIFQERGFLGALQGRYLFSALLPFIYILVRGIDHLLPEKWKKFFWLALACFFVINDAATLLFRIIPEFY